MEAKDQRVMESEYRYNRSFRNYVDRYCKEHGCTAQDAMTKGEVRRAYLHYREV